MPKRKRSDLEETLDKIEDQAVRIKASRLKARIDQGNKSLKDALQLARGFERQKLGRRQKKASSEPHTLLRLREEVIVLKELDVGAAATDYLFKQLARTKRIKESPSFIALFGHDVKTDPPKSAAEANVLGRLFKANPVKEVLPGIMNGIRQVLSLEDSKPGISSSNEPVSETVEEAREIESADLAETSDTGEKLNAPHDDSGRDGEDDVGFAAYENRLAGSSDESEGSEKDELDPMEISDFENDDEPSPDQIDDVSVSESESPESPESPGVSPPTPSQPRNKPDQKSPSTTFLPSLSMGGYYSGSESDDDMDDPSIRPRGPALPKPRKNRRGQRERQKLAELKFGKNAKHLQKQAKPRDTRNEGWDAKRGAVDKTSFDPRQRRFGKASFGSGSRGGDSSAGARDRDGSRPKPAQNANGSRKSKNGADGKPLHPSWEAARKRKLESGNAAFAGTKITFD